MHTSVRCPSDVPPRRAHKAVPPIKSALSRRQSLPSILHHLEAKSTRVRARLVERVQRLLKEKHQRLPAIIRRGGLVSRGKYSSSSPPTSPTGRCTCVCAPPASRPRPRAGNGSI